MTSPPPAPRVAAIVVHYRGLDDTRACLAALARAGIEAVLVDNSARGEAVAFVDRERPALLRLVDAGAPSRGFAAGCNAGVRAALAAGATHALFVNSDAFVDPLALGPLLEAAAEPGVGLVTGKVLLPGAPRRIWAAGGKVDRRRAVGVNTGEGELDGPQHDVARDVTFASGCFLLVARAVFDEIGLLDERYYLYMEDVELCERARAAGFRVVYEPRAVCVHRAHGASGGSHGDPGPITVYYLTRSRFLWARERLRGAERARAVAWLVATRAVRSAQEVARGRPGRARVIACAVLDGLRGRTGPTGRPL